MCNKRPWLDTPIHECGDGFRGPVVRKRHGFICAACGASIDVTPEEAARIDRAEAAWDAELDRQEAETQRWLEHERKAPLLAEAIARRQRGEA